MFIRQQEIPDSSAVGCAVVARGLQSENHFPGTGGSLLRQGRMEA